MFPCHYTTTAISPSLQKKCTFVFCPKSFLWLHLRQDICCCCGVPMVNSSPVSLQMSRRDRKFHPRPTNSSAVVSQSAAFSYLCSSFRIYWVSQPHHRAWNYCGGIRRSWCLLSRLQNVHNAQSHGCTGQLWRSLTINNDAQLCCKRNSTIIMGRLSTNNTLNHFQEFIANPRVSSLLILMFIAISACLHSLEG